MPTTMHALRLGVGLRGVPCSLGRQRLPRRGPRAAAETWWARAARHDGRQAHADGPLFLVTAAAVRGIVPRPALRLRSSGVAAHSALVSASDCDSSPATFGFIASV